MKALRMQKLFAMKIITLIFLISFFCLIKVSGQAGINKKNNSVSLELGKAGLIFNLAFDHKIKIKNYGYRVEIGSNLLKYQQVFTTGAGVYYLAGNKSNFLELGTNLNYFEYILVSDDQRDLILLFIDKPTKTYYMNLNAGYRKYTNSGLFRIGISPGLMNKGFVFGGYISFGLRF